MAINTAARLAALDTRYQSAKQGFLAASNEYSNDAPDLIQAIQARVNTVTEDRNSPEVVATVQQLPRALRRFGTFQAGLTSTVAMVTTAVGQISNSLEVWYLVASQRVMIQYNEALTRHFLQHTPDPDLEDMKNVLDQDSEQLIAVAEQAGFLASHAFDTAAETLRLRLRFMRKVLAAAAPPAQVKGENGKWYPIVAPKPVNRGKVAARVFAWAVPVFVLNWIPGSRQIPDIVQTGHDIYKEIDAAYKENALLEHIIDAPSVPNIFQIASDGLRTLQGGDNALEQQKTNLDKLVERLRKLGSEVMAAAKDGREITPQT